MNDCPWALLERILGACPCGSTAHPACPLSGWDHLGDDPVLDGQRYEHSSGAWLVLGWDGRVIDASVLHAFAGYP